jgi:hypothetical protein
MITHPCRLWAVPSLMSVLSQTARLLSLLTLLAEPFRGIVIALSYQIRTYSYS